MRPYDGSNFSCSWWKLTFSPRDDTQSAVMRLHVVCPSVTFRPRYRDHILGWNTSEIISRTNSLRLMRLLTPTWAILCNGNTPKIMVE